MKQLLKTFKKRSGFANVEGVEYERLISALLFLRALNRADDFELAQNLDGVGSIDDNVLIVEKDNKTIGYFIQQRYCNKEGRPENEVIKDLLKYYISYQRICEKYGGDVDELHMAYFTNSEVSQDRKTLDCSEHILNTGGNRFHFSLADSNISPFFSEVISYKDFLSRVRGLSSEELQAQVTREKSQFKSSEMKSRLHRLERAPNPSDVQNMLDELEGLDDVERFVSFLEDLSVFQCQAGQKDELTPLILVEFRKACGANPDMDVDNVFKFFMDRIDQWSKETGKSKALTPYSPLWRDVIIKLMNNLKSAKVRELEALGVRFNDGELKICKEKLQALDTVKISVNCSNTSLSLLKVHQALDNEEPHLVVSCETVERHLELVTRICRTKWCSALLVDGALTRGRRVVQRAAKKLIIVVSSKAQEHNDTCNLLQLDEASQESLMQKPFLFQGHRVCLNDFRKQDPQLIDIICGDVLHFMLSSNEIEVGRKLQPIIPYYIPRTLFQKRYLKKEILSCKEPHTSVAFTVNKTVFSRMVNSFNELPNQKIKNRKGIRNESRIIHLKNKTDEVGFKELAMFTEDQNYHLLRKDKKGLYWKWSKGGLDVIRHFIDPAHSKIYPESLILSTPGDLKLIIAEPGMGKSTLLNVVADRTKKEDPTTCIVRINLVDHSRSLKDCCLKECEQVDSFLTRAVVTENCNVLENELMRYIISNSLNVVFLIDGFDEISPEFAEQGIKLIKCLQEKDVGRLWITSRSVLSERLQNELSTLPFALQPFTKDDQMNFLKKYWKSDKIKPNDLEKFVIAVLEVMKRSLEQEDFELAAIPLQTMLIAEAFRHAYEEFEATGRMQLPKQLDVVELFELFIEKKYVIHLESREGISPDHKLYERHFSRCEKENNENHCTLALMLLLSEEDVNSLNDPSIKMQHGKLLQEPEVIARVGIVTSIRDGKPHFVHRTFAEYFVALWLSKNFRKLCPLFLKKLLDPSFTFVLKWFDHILSKGCAVHKVVLNNDSSRLVEMLDEPVDLDEQDDGGRKPIHLAAKYGRTSILELLLSREASVNATDGVLGWTPVQYGDHFEAWESVEMLLKNGANKRDLRHLSDIVKKDVKLNEVLSLAFERGWTHMVRFILSEGVKVDKVIDCEGSTLLHKAAKHGQTEVLAYLMCYEFVFHNYGKNWEKIWTFSQNKVLKEPKLIRKLSRKPNVNVENHFGLTPLHLAIIGGHKETVQWLVDAGADVNHRDGVGYTQLHWAVRDGCKLKVERLLSYGADVNKLTAADETALHLALQQTHGLNRADSLRALFTPAGETPSCSALQQPHGLTNLNVLQSLLTTRFNLRLEDHNGFTAIHWAAVTDDYVLLECLLLCGAEINKQDSLGSSALHWAVWRGLRFNVKILLEQGANVNARNLQGNTPLHWAARQGNSIMICDLVNAGAGINTANRSGCTPLCMATKTQAFGAMSVLKQAGARACESCFDDAIAFDLDI